MTQEDNITRIKAKIEEIEKARAKAFQGKYEFNISTIKEAVIWLEKLDRRLWLKFDKGTAVDEYSAAETAKLFCLTANEITKLTAALNLAVDTIETYIQNNTWAEHMQPEDLISDIAEILTSEHESPNGVEGERL